MRARPHPPGAATPRSRLCVSWSDGPSSGALAATGGSVEKAAKLLGIGRATLYRRLARYEAAEDK